MASPRTMPISAFTRLELFVTIACVFVVLVILVPSLAKLRMRSKRTNCTRCLNEVGLDFRVFAVDHNDHLPMELSQSQGGTKDLGATGAVYPHFRALSNELSSPMVLVCPADVARTCARDVGNALSDSNLSYFVNVDAVGGDQSIILSGDRNLTNRTVVGSRLLYLSGASIPGWGQDIHTNKGNLLFADGSVRAFRNGVAASAVRLPPDVTNRLAIP